MGIVLSEDELPPDALLPGITATLVEHCALVRLLPVRVRHYLLGIRLVAKGQDMEFPQSSRQGER